MLNHSITWSYGYDDSWFYQTVSGVHSVEILTSNGNSRNVC